MFQLSNILQNDQSVILKHMEVMDIKQSQPKEARGIRPLSAMPDPFAVSDLMDTSGKHECVAGSRCR